jgi:DNA-binding transcriptional regulator YdaS (Cro superfamily)
MKLRDYLSEKNLTYAQFGSLIGAGKSQVCRWAVGSRVPSLQMSIAIESATNGLVTARDFVPDRGNAGLVQKCA